MMCVYFTYTMKELLLYTILKKGSSTELNQFASGQLQETDPGWLDFYLLRLQLPKKFSSIQNFAFGH